MTPQNKKVMWIVISIVGGTFLLGVIFAIALNLFETIKKTAEERAIQSEERQKEETKPAKWVEVKSYSGNGAVNKNTEIFKISSKQWKICYEIKEIEGSYATIIIDVHREGEPSDKVADIIHAEHSVADSSVIYESGNFYLGIDTGNCSYWAITIQEKK